MRTIGKVDLERYGFTHAYRSTAETDDYTRGILRSVRRLEALLKKVSSLPPPPA